MQASLPSVILLFGLALLVVAQIAIALYAFTGNPFKGLLCVFVPFYIYVYARRHEVSRWFMRLWYLGIALFVAGAVLAS